MRREVFSKEKSRGEELGARDRNREVETEVVLGADSDPRLILHQEVGVDGWSIRRARQVTQALIQPSAYCGLVALSAFVCK